MNPGFREVVGNCRWEELTIGRSGATLHRLVGLEGQETRYLKVMSRFAGSDLAFEAERTKWVSAYLSAPKVLDFREEGIFEYLLTSEVPGIHAADPHWAGRADEILPVLAQGLRRVHELPVEKCPYDNRTGVVLQMAKLNLHSGLVEGEDAEEELKDLVKTRPETPDEDLVVLHGDYSFPNVLLTPEGDGVSGYVDWGALGIGDRYLDLAIAVKSVILNVGEDGVAAFLEGYSPEPLDAGKLEWFRRLNRFL
ncbi:aminoglycoside 3'-phosphotransferase [Tumebacillus sp. ITR2]|uniref:Aminoglycoside 3'-phosphotransferase n=1 Tax=Tumebacillus amylolyticus TaxID=2801339 RepID=A0ABS1J6J6_9BACL|nr:aminoglycoside 3'-phosphotransferase [Tumebacillus amylolyticus]MBL0385874.1 aminoglycoside 3'-phosphotransferase [Tumebacillus amylolyticus]